MAVETLYSTQIPNNSREVSGTVVVYRDDVSLLCDTSLAPVNILLLMIPSGYWNTEYILYVKDLLGNAATNNITIIAPTGFLVNGAQQYVMNENGQSVEVTVSSNTDYNVNSTGSGSGGLTKLVVARTAFVSKNGNDVTGLIERLDQPFYTITAAINALVAAESTYYTSATPGGWLSAVDANNRLLVKAFAGAYLEGVTVSNYIDLDLSDATVGILGAAYAITDNGVQANSIIYGASAIVATVKLLNSSSSVSIYANSIFARYSNAVIVNGGTLQLYVPNITNYSNPDLGAFSTIVTNGGKVIVNSARVNNLSVAGYTIQNLSGTFIVNNCTLLTPTGTPPIYTGDGTFLVYGACQSNFPLTTASIQKVGSIIVDANVQ